MYSLTASVPDGDRPSRLEFGFLYYPVRTLFDSDASSSFISPLLVESLHLDTSLVDDPLVVSNPIGLHNVFGFESCYT